MAGIRASAAYSCEVLLHSLHLSHMTKRQKLAVIDAHALIHRAYHALPPMTTPQGVPTNAAYGFAAMLIKMLATLKPTHVIAAFDMKGPTFRHKEFADYKAHRKAAADDLVVQFDVVRDIVRSFDIPILEKTGYEADDIVGTVVEKFSKDVPIVIVTGDADALQLVDEQVSVFTLRRGISDTILYTPELVREAYGFDPKYIPDYKGLAGDASDNIPGVAGIGKKTAQSLVSHHGSIESIFDHLDELPPRVQNRLRGHKGEALTSRKLATIHRNVAVDISLDEAAFDTYEPLRVTTLFRTLGFKSLMTRLPNGKSGVQPTLLDTHADADSLPKGYHLAQSPEEQRQLREALAGASLIAFDTETDGLGARTSPIIGMSFAVRNAEGSVEAWYVPTNSRDVRAWRDILENENISKTGHNLKYDAEVLLQAGIILRGIVFDSMLASYLLSAGSRSHGMDDLAQEKLNYTPIPITDLIGSGKEQISMRDVPLLAIARYAAEDADVSLRLMEVLQKELQDEKLTDVLRDIELPLIEVLAHMETTGIAVDAAMLESLNKKVIQRIRKIEKEICSLAGKEFNVSSPKQLKEVLFHDLRLPTVGIKKTQSGYSTAASELEKLRDAHPIIPLLFEFRELSKLQTTYLDALPRLVDPKTGRIYTSFNQVVAATGRLSSSNPNLQNIPVRTELGREIREAFIAKEGCVLVKADYSQLELRIAAHMSQDPGLLEAFRSGQDIHRATAAAVFGVVTQDVTDDMRRQAKTLNFGVLYGMGAQSFAQAAGISLEEARSFIDRYKKQYGGIEALIEETVLFAQTHGYVETMFGRKRYVPEIHSKNPAIRAAAERMAFNFPIQGTEADILKKAMISVYEMIGSAYRDAALVLTVHDELVCEVPENDGNAFAVEMKRRMESVLALDVPLIADVGIGKNWNDIQPIA